MRTLKVRIRRRDGIVQRYHTRRSYVNIPPRHKKYFERVFDKYPRLKLKRDKGVKDIVFTDINDMAIYDEDKILMTPMLGKVFDNRKLLESEKVSFLASALNHELTHSSQKQKIGLEAMKRHQKEAIDQMKKPIKAVRDKAGLNLGLMPLSYYQFLPEEYDAYKMDVKFNPELREEMSRDSIDMMVVKDFPSQLTNPVVKKNYEEYKEAMRKAPKLRDLPDLWK